MVACYALTCIVDSEAVQIDGDDPKHVKWIFEKSQARANEYNITGITYRLTQGQWRHHLDIHKVSNVVIM